MKSILVTGGAGYIGSHTICELLLFGYSVVVADNFSNSQPLVIDRLEKITGKKIVLRQGDVADAAWVKKILAVHDVAAVIHFAGSKAVGESVAQPLKYYANNIGSTVGLMQAMQHTACRTLIFSSSATVYGGPYTEPIDESFPTTHTSPYGHTKLVCEGILKAQQLADPSWRMGILRYFNPVGAHPSGLIGEDPSGPPNNLMPYVSQVAVGKRPYLNVHGNDYDTPDGTGVRDYIHVQDLAQGHVAALQALQAKQESFTVNLGTGRGYSVLEVIRAFEKASGRPVPYKVTPRRPGDVGQYYADPGLAHTLLGWRAVHTLDDMCKDSWHWQQQNPDGYAGS